MLTVHYRWHPQLSQRVRVVQRGGETVRVELPDGRRCVVAPWMLDAAACARHDEGPPLVAVDALDELATLIRSLGDGEAGREEANHETEIEAEGSTAAGVAAEQSHPVAVFRRAVVGGGSRGLADPSREGGSVREGRGR
jgi:hypothetical protein